LTALAWSSVADRLHSARSLWLTTTAPDGPPHAVPVWGAVLDGVLHVYTSRGTRKARNVAAEPRVVVHLPDAEDVLIVDGELRDVGGPADVPGVVAAFAAKYPAPADRAYLPGIDPAVDVVYALHPRRALAWQLTDFENTQLRWQATHPGTVD
jgi:Pyridoxamine 5'-phosphate oxidase